MSQSAIVLARDPRGVVRITFDRPEVHNAFDDRLIEELEIGRQVLTNEDIAQRTHATGGNITHVDMSMGRAGPMRPARGLGGYRTPVSGLFLSGAGTHPGGGITGAPGYNSARAVLSTLGAGRTGGG